MALGADVCNSARAMMYALGCIQAMKCNTNKCPTGVATQDRELMKGLVVESKADRVANFQTRTVNSACEIVGAMGCASSADVRPTQLMMRQSTQMVMSYAEAYPWVKYGCLIDGSGPRALQERWDATQNRTGQTETFISKRAELLDMPSLYGGKQHMNSGMRDSGESEFTTPWRGQGGTG